MSCVVPPAEGLNAEQRWAHVGSPMKCRYRVGALAGGAPPQEPLLAAVQQLAATVQPPCMPLPPVRVCLFVHCAQGQHLLPAILFARLPLSTAEWQHIQAPCPGSLPAAHTRAADQALAREVVRFAARRRRSTVAAAPPSWQTGPSRPSVCHTITSVVQHYPV